MSGLWSAATRGEGLRMGRRDGGLIVGIVLVAGLFKLVFRFFSGRPMRGDKARKTDAEWRVAGTRKLRQNDRTPSRWSYLPEWKRAAIRTATLFVMGVGLWGWITGEWWASMTQTVMTLTAGLIVFGAIWWLIVTIDTSVREAKHNRTLTKPFKAAVAPLLGLSDRDVKVVIPRGNLSSVKGEDAA